LPFPFLFLDTAMTAHIIDGKALAEELRENFKARVEKLAGKGHKPGLVVILVGEDPASQVYVRNKVSGCLAIGMHSEKIVYDAAVDQQVVLDRIAELNADPAIHGILVQLPLPGHFDEAKVLEAIAAEKDVDGFHAENVGALAQGNPRFIPCTPYGVMQMFEKGGVDLSGKEAVVIGRSNIVGKPMALLLINAGATVTVCNSRTRDLKSHTRRVDILVAAVGKAKFVTGDMVKPGAVVIDVGINRLPDGKLCGDVDFAGCLEVAGQITPVPGGVGPMTITMLLANTIEAAERKAGI
jgi:methylenetetrahydrofolate dehydrogenase (NADP+)/methenyltetrahydrofolate cyclohydrolase